DVSGHLCRSEAAAWGPSLSASEAEVTASSVEPSDPKSRWAFSFRLPVTPVRCGPAGTTGRGERGRGPVAHERPGRRRARPGERRAPRQGPQSHRRGGRPPGAEPRHAGGGGGGDGAGPGGQHRFFHPEQPRSV
ncbi:hypothetical protein THAOC_27921, partial [Thalassiosira oceanica]